MWEHLREAPGYVFSRHQIVQLGDKTANLRAALDAKWKSIEREDAALDEAIYNRQNEVKNSLKKAIAGLSGLVGNALELAGLDGAGNVGEAIQVGSEKLLQAFDVMRAETAVWKTFVNEREVARKIHEEISPDRIDKAMEYANALSVPGDRKDFRVFKDRAIRILERHRDSAKKEYDKFTDDNKGKFIGSLDTRWFWILLDQQEVDGWKELFDLANGELQTLLTRHEEGFVNLKDEGRKRAFKENFDKMTRNSREMIANWHRGKTLYDEYERELKR